MFLLNVQQNNGICEKNVWWINELVVPYTFNSLYTKYQENSGTDQKSDRLHQGPIS